MKKTNKKKSEDKKAYATRRKKVISKSDSSKLRQDKGDLIVVSIGASAGGLEALHIDDHQSATGCQYGLCDCSAP